MPFDNTPVEPAVKVDPVIETLIGMRELIAKDWIKGAFHSGDRHCLVGAYSKMDSGTLYFDVFNALGFQDGGDAMRWNDCIASGQQDVLDRIDQAIENRKKQRQRGI